MRAAQLYGRGWSPSLLSSTFQEILLLTLWGPWMKFAYLRNLIFYFYLAVTFILHDTDHFYTDFYSDTLSGF